MQQQREIGEAKGNKKNELAGSAMQLLFEEAFSTGPQIVSLSFLSLLGKWERKLAKLYWWTVLSIL